MHVKLIFSKLFHYFDPKKHAYCRFDSLDEVERFFAESKLSLVQTNFSRSSTVVLNILECLVSNNLIKKKEYNK